MGEKRFVPQEDFFWVHFNFWENEENHARKFQWRVNAHQLKVIIMKLVELKLQSCVKPEQKI